MYFSWTLVIPIDSCTTPYPRLLKTWIHLPQHENWQCAWPLHEKVTQRHNTGSYRITKESDSIRCDIGTLKHIYLSTITINNRRGLEKERCNRKDYCDGPSLETSVSVTYQGRSTDADQDARDEAKNWQQTQRQMLQKKLRLTMGRRWRNWFRRMEALYRLPVRKVVSTRDTKSREERH